MNYAKKNKLEAELQSEWNNTQTKIQELIREYLNVWEEDITQKMEEGSNYFWFEIDDYLTIQFNCTYHMKIHQDTYEEQGYVEGKITSCNVELISLHDEAYETDIDLTKLKWAKDIIINKMMAVDY